MSIVADSIRENGFIHSLCDDAADEIEKLEQDLDKPQESYKELETQLASYKLDAERYRWLRHGDNDEPCMETPEYPGQAIDGYYFHRFLLRNEHLDERIDKHMQIDKEYYAGFGVQHD